MEKQVTDLSADELERLIERTIDRRLGVWLTQVLDALPDSEEDGTEFKPEFAASLRRSIDQAEAGDGIDLNTFREQLGR